MAVYSEIVSDEEIVSALEACKPKNVLIVACGGCTNESLAFKKNTYIFLSEEKTKIAEELNAGRARAFATETEAERLLNLLIQKGYNAKIVLAPIGDEMLCIQKKNKSALLEEVEDIDSFDFVLGLCCPAGVVGIMRLIRNARIFSVMRPKGQLFYVYEDEDNKRKINFDESKII